MAETGSLPTAERELVTTISMKLNSLGKAVTFSELREACGDETLILSEGQPIVDKDLLDEVMKKLKVKADLRSSLYDYLVSPPKSYKLEGSAVIPSVTVPTKVRSENWRKLGFVAMIIAAVVAIVALVSLGRTAWLNRKPETPVNVQIKPTPPSAIVPAVGPPLNVALAQQTEEERRLSEESLRKAKETDDKFNNVVGQIQTGTEINESQLAAIRQQQAEAHSITAELTRVNETLQNAQGVGKEAGNTLAQAIALGKKTLEKAQAPVPIKPPPPAEAPLPAKPEPNPAVRTVVTPPPAVVAAPKSHTSAFAPKPKPVAKKPAPKKQKSEDREPKEDFIRVPIPPPGRATVVVPFKR